MQIILNAILDRLFGPKCLSGTRDCWGRCHGCIMKRIAAENAERQSARIVVDEYQRDMARGAE